MEKTENIKRSDLWTSIYHIVSQIPRKDVKGDAMDYSSVATEVERLVDKQIKELEKLLKTTFDMVVKEGLPTPELLSRVTQALNSK